MRYFTTLSQQILTGIKHVADDIYLSAKRVNKATHNI